MRKTIFIAILLISFYSSGQAQDKDFHFGFCIYPNYSIGMITNDGSVSVDMQNYYEDIEIGKPSISGNIFVEYNFTNKFSSSIGIGYQNCGEKTKKQDLTYNTSDPLLGTHVRFVYNHHNLEIPLLFKYNITNEIYVTAGTSGIFNIYNTSTSKMYFENKSTERNTNEDNSTSFRKINLSLNAGIGFIVLSKEKFSLFSQPAFQLGLLGISKNAPLNRKMISTGLILGIKF